MPISPVIGLMSDFLFQNGPWVSILIVSTFFVLAAWVVLNFVRLGHNDRSPIEAPVEFEDQPYDEIFERGVENQPNQWMSSADRSDGNKSPDDCPK